MVRFAFCSGFYRHGVHPIFTAYRIALPLPLFVAATPLLQITMAFGIRNVPDRLKALKEFRRILATPSQPAGSSSEPSESGPAGGNGDAETGENAKAMAEAGGASSSVLAILELQDPESGLLAAASRAFIKCVRSPSLQSSLMCFCYVSVLSAFSWIVLKHSVGVSHPCFTVCLP